MKKTLLISGVLLALTASVAAAGGINLTWNDCGPLSSGSGVLNKAFACNSNAGNNDLYLSFEPEANIPDVNGSNPIIDLQSASAALPAWWQFKNPGTCRLASLSAITAITGTCFDTWSGQASPGIAAYFTIDNAPQVVLGIPNRARILASVAVPGAFAANVDPGTEYFLMVVRINNAKTVGTGLCAGCQDPVCLVMNEVLLTSNNSGDNRLYAPYQSGGSTFATWQGGAIGGAGCPGATPAVNKTWGQLKSIYR